MISATRVAPSRSAVVSIGDAFPRQLRRNLGRALLIAVPDQHAAQRRSHGAMGADEPARHLARPDDQQGLRRRRREKLGAKGGIGGGPPIGDLGAVDDGKRPSVRAVEKNADRLHRRQDAAGQIGRKAGDQLARHEPAAIDGMADEIHLLLAAESAILDLDLRPPMGGFDGIHQKRECQRLFDFRGIDKAQNHLLERRLNHVSKRSRSVASITPSIRFSEKSRCVSDRARLCRSVRNCSWPDAGNVPPEPRPRA